VSKILSRMRSGTKQTIICFLMGFILGVMAPFLWAEILVSSGSSFSESFMEIDFTLIAMSIFTMSALIYFTDQRDLAAIFLGIAVGMLVGTFLLTIEYFRGMVY